MKINRIFTFVIKIVSSIENESKSALQVHLPGSVIFQISVDKMALYKKTISIYMYLVSIIVVKKIIVICGIKK